jgi:hypothetical protein
MGAFGKMPIVSSVAGLAAKTPVAKATGLDEQAMNVKRNAAKKGALFDMAKKPTSLLSSK